MDTATVAQRTPGLSPLALDALMAAALEPTAIHHDLCGSSGTGRCDCGVPDMLAEVAALVAVRGH